MAKVTCPRCNGSGKCPTCGGRGTIRGGNPERPIHPEQKCRACEGMKRCPNCYGKGEVEQ
ncbi:MAG: hypothetical protein NZL85_00720 [Fimbriimonadales bacterium]|nr:hypothetical protein [Fimbriimonadales bacterium]